MIKITDRLFRYFFERATDKELLDELFHRGYGRMTIKTFENNKNYTYEALVLKKELK